MADKGDDQLTFEEAFEQLEETVRRLEKGGLPLDEAMTLYERGQHLAALCASRLDEAELKISQLNPEDD